MTTNSQIILYKTQTGEIKIDVHLEFVKFASQNDFFYQKIKEIYTTSIDYDAKSDKTSHFFKVVQNKLLWAISQQSLAELEANIKHLK
jgi:hypothetical protein